LYLVIRAAESGPGVAHSRGGIAKKNRQNERVTIQRTCLVVALTAMTAPTASGCSSWGSNKGFESDFAPDMSGQPPRERRSTPG
jgi:hypothetical protein